MSSASAQRPAISSASEKDGGGKKEKDKEKEAHGQPTPQEIDAATDISEHDIARRAYDLYLTRGSEPGHDVEDWLLAEQELRSRSGASTV